MSQSFKGRLKSSRVFDIFVAGLPSSTTEEAVKQFFEALGPVRNVQVIKIDSKKEDTQKRRIFCRLQITSEAFYQHLISNKNIKFSSRLLFCQEYKSGKKLTAHSSNLNARRVVVKKVPRYLSLANVYRALEAAAGTIEILYEYKPDDHDSKAQQGYLKSVSVTFVARSSTNF